MKKILMGALITVAVVVIFFLIISIALVKL